MEVLIVVLSTLISLAYKQSSLYVTVFAKTDHSVQIQDIELLVPQKWRKKAWSCLESINNFWDGKGVAEKKENIMTSEVAEAFTRIESPMHSILLIGVLRRVA